MYTFAWTWRWGKHVIAANNCSLLHEVREILAMFWLCHNQGTTTGHWCPAFWLYTYLSSSYSTINIICHDTVMDVYNQMSVSYRVRSKPLITHLMNPSAKYSFCRICRLGGKICRIGHEVFSYIILKFYTHANRNQRKCCLYSYKEHPPDLTYTLLQLSMCTSRWTQFTFTCTGPASAGTFTPISCTIKTWPGGTCNMRKANVTYQASHCVVFYFIKTFNIILLLW